MIIPESGPGIPTIDVSETTISHLDELTRHIRDGLGDMSEAEFFDAVDACAPNAEDIVPDETALLRRLASHIGPKAVLLSLPPETVAAAGPTPSYHRSSEEQQLISSDICRALAISLSGLYAFGNRAFHGGSMHHDIIFDPNATNSSAKDQEMRLHVDGLYVNRNPGHYPAPGQPNLNLSPDFLTLHFIRNHEQVPTVLVFPEWDALTEDTREILSQPCLYLNKTLPPLSVLYGDNPADPWIRYVTDEEYIGNAPDQATRNALGELNGHLAARQVTVAMKAGQILLFDNRRLLHGRASRSRTNLPPPAEWRWQRRVHCVTDPERIQQDGLPPRQVNTDTVYAYGQRNLPLRNNV